MEHKVADTKRLIHYLVLSLVLILYGMNIFSLSSIDSVPPMWDEAVHLKDSLVFHNIISDPFQLNPQIVKDIIN